MCRNRVHIEKKKDTTYKEIQVENEKRSKTERNSTHRYKKGETPHEKFS